MTIDTWYRMKLTKVTKIKQSWKCLYFLPRRIMFLSWLFNKVNVSRLGRSHYTCLQNISIKLFVKNWIFFQLTRTKNKMFLLGVLLLVGFAEAQNKCTNHSVAICVENMKQFKLNEYNAIVPTWNETQLSNLCG